MHKLAYTQNIPRHERLESYYTSKRLPSAIDDEVEILLYRKKERSYSDTIVFV